MFAQGKTSTSMRSQGRSWVGWGFAISCRFAGGDHSCRRATGGRGCRVTTSAELRGREPLKTVPPISLCSFIKRSWVSIVHLVGVVGEARECAIHRPLLLWSECLYPPKIHTLKPSSQCGGIRGWGLWEAVRVGSS